MTLTTTRKKTPAKRSATRKPSRDQKTRLADAYFAFVQWSDEDNLYIGRCPDLFLGGCHGNDPLKVYAELRFIIEDWVAHLLEEGEPLPPVTLHPPSLGG